MTALQTADLAIEAADELLARAESGMLTSDCEDPAESPSDGRSRRGDQPTTSVATSDTPNHASAGHLGVEPT